MGLVLPPKFAVFEAALRPGSPGAKISVCHGVVGVFAASGTIIMPNQSA
jgi:hypothetical protein